MARFLMRLPLAFTYQTSKNGVVLRPLPAKKRSRFAADFAVTAKEPQWKCVSKYAPTLELGAFNLSPRLSRRF
jgi:hypothetical protein